MPAVSKAMDMHCRTGAKYYVYQAQYLQKEGKTIPQTINGYEQSENSNVVFYASDNWVISEKVFIGEFIPWGNGNQYIIYTGDGLRRFYSSSDLTKLFKDFEFRTKQNQQSQTPTESSGFQI